MTTLLQTSIKSLPFLHRGKVRDIYAVGEDQLLVIQTDRLSAFDVILDDPIPGKGEVLTALSNFWFAKLGHLVPNHMTGIDPESVVKGDAERDQVRGRAMVVKKFKPLTIEAMFQPGESFTYRAAKRIELVLGNAGGLDMTFNEKRLEKIGKSGEVVTVVFTPQGVETTRRELPEPAQD